VMRSLLETCIKETDGVSHVEIPSLRTPLPSGHKLSGRTPLEVMAACAQSPDGSFDHKFTIVGCGSSHHAALLAEYLIETIARIPVVVQYGSEFRYAQPLFNTGDVLVVVSNSGETYDSLASLRNVKSSGDGEGLVKLAVVNEAKSSIAQECDACICTDAGKEVGIASTKVFSCTVLSFVLLAIDLGEAAGTLAEAEKNELLQKLKELPDLVQQVLDREARPLFHGSESPAQNGSESSGSTNGRAINSTMPGSPDGKASAVAFKPPARAAPQAVPMGRLRGSLSMGDCELWDIGCQNVLAGNFIFLGRGFNFPIALEGAMKCKEIAYIHAEGYPAAEMKHGPIALIDQFMPVVAIAPRSDPCYEKIKANIEEVRTRNGAVIAITEEGETELEEICEHVIKVPPTHDYLMPLIAVLPLQLLAYMMGTLRGNKVDNPRGLEKTVSKDPCIA